MTHFSEIITQISYLEFFKNFYVINSKYTVLVEQSRSISQEKKKEVATASRSFYFYMITTLGHTSLCRNRDLASRIFTFKVADFLWTLIRGNIYNLWIFFFFF